MNTNINTQYRNNLFYLCYFQNTQTNLELVDALVETATTAPETQIEIKAKFLEISQTNLNELGFDWLLGSFELPGGSGIRGSGGTVGSGNIINKGSFPIDRTNTKDFNTFAGVQDSANPRVINPNQYLRFPTGSTSPTSGPVTAGNRDGTSAISVNAIDALLLNSPLGPAAGAFAVAGIFTDPEFQVVLRAINQKKGIDLISSPTVTTKSGRNA